MSSRCASDEAILLLLDGELSENEAARLRSHLGACSACAARRDDVERTLGQLRAPLSDVGATAAVEEVMRRLPAATADAAALGARPRFGRPRVLGGAVAVLLAAAAVALVPRLARGPRDDEGSFSARGATVGTSMARGVGVTVYRARDALHPLSNGAVVGADEAFAVKYRSLLDAPAYLLAFAVDAKDAVHWICPAYLDAKSAPSSVRLAPTPNETLASSAMQLEAPPPGPMRIVAILTTEPLAAAQVDALDGGDLSTAALLARWPAADVRELVTVEVRPAP